MQETQAVSYMSNAQINFETKLSETNKHWDRIFDSRFVCLHFFVSYYSVQVEVLRWADPSSWDYYKICKTKLLEGRAIAQAVSHRLPTAAGLGHVGFMEGKVALGQVFF
jgi:hypothetical protein